MFNSMRRVLLLLIASLLFVFGIIQMGVLDYSLAKINNSSQKIIQESTQAEIEDCLKFSVQATVSNAETYYKLNVGKIPAAELEKNILGMLDGIRFSNDGYFFAYEYTGVRVVALENQAMVGKNLFDIADKNGVKLIQELLKKSKEGGGFLIYVWKNPATGNDEPKLSYCMPLKIGTYEIMIGTGIYLLNLEKAKGKIDAKFMETRNSIFMIGALSVLSIIIILVFIIYIFMNKTIINPLLEFTTSAHLIASGDLSRDCRQEGLRWEIKLLGTAIQQMMINMKEMITSITQTSHSLDRNVNDMGDSLRATSAAAEEVAGNIIQVAAGVHTTFQNVATISELATNSSADISEVTKEIGIVDQKLLASVTNSVNGQQKLGGLIKLITNAIEKT